MLEDSVTAQNVVSAIVVSYLLGALPFAHLAGRFKGVDVFSTGNTLAGTANVFFNVGHRTGVLVFLGDVSKGAAAVVTASLLDISGPWALATGGAAVLGHWKSIFSSFRGGDGMAPLMGVALAIAPALAALGALVGLATIGLMWRSSLRSTWGICACFVVVLGVSQYYQLERGQNSGLFVLATFVLLRSLFTRRRRGRLDDAYERDDPSLDVNLPSYFPKNR